jgi:hypothetical protein
MSGDLSRVKGLRGQGIGRAWKGIQKRKPGSVFLQLFVFQGKFSTKAFSSEAWFFRSLDFLMINDIKESFYPVIEKWVRHRSFCPKRTAKGVRYKVKWNS